VTTSGVASEAWDGFNEDDTPVTVGDPAGRLASAGGKRDELWESALDALAAHPAQGVGPGTFEFWWQREGAGTENVEDAHSLPLELAAELGLPGLALLLAFLGGALALALRARGSLSRPDDFAAGIAMTAAFIVFLFSSSVDWMWEETAVGALALGGIAVAAAGGSPPLPRRVREGRIGPAWGRPAIVAVAIAAAALQVQGIASTQQLRQSQSALAAGDTSRARDRAESAIDWQPWAATPHAQLAVIHAEAGRLTAAEDEIAVAIDREPTNWRWPLVLAMIEGPGKAAAPQSRVSGE
jgi:O-antigen ligase